MSTEQEIQNYCSQENGVQIANVSSMLPNCPAFHLLVNDRKSLWMSQPGLPQSITLDLSQMNQRPKMIKCFGFDCWHDYQSNPSVMEILVSTDGQNFITWITVYPELRQGLQLFQIDPLGRRYNFIKVIIRETFGASKTYMNQMLLLEEHIQMATESMSESQQQTDKSQSNYKQSEYEQQTKQQTSHFQNPSITQNNELDQPHQKQSKTQLAPQQQTQMAPQQKPIDDLQEKIIRMDREVVLLKQSSQPGLDAQKNRNYLAIDEFNALQNYPTLTSTEKEVKSLRDEITHWKSKFEALKTVVDRLEQNKQYAQPQTPKPPKSGQINNDQFELLIERKINERVFEIETKFQIQFQLQEQKFKEQQLELISKIRSGLSREDPREDPKPRGRSKASKKSHSQKRKIVVVQQSSSSSSSDGDKENVNQANKRRTSTNQKKVATLLTQLQAKLSLRAKKVEELNTSSHKKTKKRRSYQDVIKRATSSSSDSD